MSSCRAAVWTVIRADKRSVWRDESRGFVPLLAHKHYIEHFRTFNYRFRGKLYRDHYRYRIIAQPYYILSYNPLFLINLMIAFICFPELDHHLIMTTHICTVLFYLTDLHSICHVPYATLLYRSLFYFICYFFLQCPHLYICIVCMYIWSNCIYLYLNVYCQCLMLTVCTKGLRVHNFNSLYVCTVHVEELTIKLDLTWISWL